MLGLVQITGSQIMPVCEKAAASGWNTLYLLFQVNKLHVTLPRSTTVSSSCLFLGILCSFCLWSVRRRLFAGKSKTSLVNLYVTEKLISIYGLGNIFMKH